MAPPLTEVADIQLQLTTELSTPKGWKAELAWLTYNKRFTHTNGHQSATGRAQWQEKFADQRPLCQATNSDNKDYIANFSLCMHKTAIFPLLV